MKIEFLPFAKVDYDEAIAYYKEIDNNLSLRFKNEIKNSIDRIVDFPNLYQIVKDDIHKCVVHTFPYSIYYIVEEHIIYIYAIANHHKNFQL